MRQLSRQSMIAKFINTRDPEDGYEIENLTINIEYEVIGIEADNYRIIDDKNEPILFSPNCYEVVNSNIPSFWVTRVGEDGEKYSYLSNWNEIGFFENFLSIGFYCYFYCIAIVLLVYWGRTKSIN